MLRPAWEWTPEIRTPAITSSSRPSPCSMRLLAGSIPFMQPLSRGDVAAVCTLAATLAVARSPASAVSCCTAFQTICCGAIPCSGCILQVHF